MAEWIKFTDDSYQDGVVWVRSSMDRELRKMPGVKLAQDAIANFLMGGGVQVLFIDGGTVYFRVREGRTAQHQTCFHSDEVDDFLRTLHHDQQVICVSESQVAYHVWYWG